MKEEFSIQEVLQFVGEAENAVINAQSYSSQQTFQTANQQLQLASQQLHEAKNHIHPTDEEHQKQLHRAKEHLRNLQETQNSLVWK